jgi:uncharacterized protein DUF2867
VSGQRAVTRTGPPHHRRLAPRVSPLMAATIGPVDWCNAFWVALPPGGSRDPRFWRAVLFGDEGTTRRRSRVMRLRDVVARRLGLRSAATGDGVTYPVLAQDGHEVVVGMDDRHLDFRVGLSVQDLGRDVLVVTTAVRRHNQLGRAYFALVRPAHFLVVPLWARRAVRGSDGGGA